MMQVTSHRSSQAKEMGVGSHDMWLADSPIPQSHHGHLQGHVAKQGLEWYRISKTHVSLRS